MKMQNYHLIIIGGGLSGAATILRLTTKILNSECDREFRIGVVEKSGEFWKGIPYGKRSSINSLLITPLKDFITGEDQRAFITWLEQNQEKWLYLIKRENNATLDKWLTKNYELITQKRWQQICLPRFLFGIYLNESVSKNIDLVHQRGLARIDLIIGEAIDIDKTEQGDYRVTLQVENDKQGTVITKKIVLAIGSPPIKSFSGVSMNKKQFLYIRDPYFPELSFNLFLIRSFFYRYKNSNTILIGANATCLELLYFFHTCEQFHQSGGEIAVLSTRGVFPVLVKEKQVTYPFKSIDTLLNNPPFTALQLIQAIEKEIENISISIDNILMHLIELVVKAIDLMNEEERKRFFHHHGMRFSKIVRRVGQDYWLAANLLIQDDKLQMLKGEFFDIQETEEGNFLNYLNAKRQLVKHDLPLHLIINCSGSEGLRMSSSTLIANLVHKKICKINDSNRGFEVNENFEANKDFYIMGPLLAGYINKKLCFWHLENASKILCLSTYLAEVLFKSLLSIVSFPKN